MLPIRKQNDGADEIKQALRNLLDRRTYHEQRIEEIRTAYSLSAWAPSPTPKGKSSSHRRLEIGALKLTEAEQELKRIDADIARYVKILIDHRAEIRDADAMIQLMRMRYLKRMEWNDIAFQLYGDNRDYAARHRSYRRKLFRLHDSACSSIWDFWQSVTNSIPQGERHTQITRVVQYDG